jgi:protein-tyrosine phosphatase
MSGWWSRLAERFGSAPPARPLGELGCDLHAHWLPGLDDGARDLDESLAMLRGFADRGYRALIATPHVMGDHYRNTPDGIRAALERTREAARAEGLDLRLEAAAEYYLDDAFLHLLDGGGELLPLPGGRLLFELSYLNRPNHLQEAIFRMQTSGWKPVLAHPERYPYFHGDPRLGPYRELAEQGVELQVNLGSLTGRHGEGARRTARELLDAGLVDLLGTDLHRADQWAGLEAVARDRRFHRWLDRHPAQASWFAGGETEAP